MYIQSGRPDIFSALQSVIAGVRSSYYSTGWSDDSRADLPHGVIVGSCGPTALMDDAAQAVGRVSWRDWKDVGGVESVEECVLSFSHSILVVAMYAHGISDRGFGW
jgi:ferric-chelate reductase